MRRRPFASSSRAGAMALALRGDGGAFRGASVERARERARGLCIFLSFYFSIYLRLHQSTVSEVRGWQKDEKGWKGGLISAAKTPTRSATPEDYRFELCVECAPTSLPPRSPPSLIHADWMVSATKYSTRSECQQLVATGISAGLHILTGHAGVVECAPASPYTRCALTNA